MQRENYLIDMDGVLIHGNKMIPGADEFIQRLKKKGKKFLITTNNPSFTPGDLVHRLKTFGLNIEPEQIFTSAMAGMGILTMLSMAAVFLLCLWFLRDPRVLAHFRTVTHERR